MFESGYQSNIFDKTLGTVKNDKKIKELCSKLNTIKSELVTLNSEKDKHDSDIKKYKSELITKETERQMSESITLLIERNDKIRETIKELKDEEAKTVKEIKKEQEERKRLNDEVKELNEKIGKVEDEKFTDFLKKAKVKTLQEFEGANIKDIEAQVMQKQAHQESLNRINAQIQQLGVEQCERTIEIFKTEQKDVEKDIIELNTKLEEVTGELTEKRNKKNDAQKEYFEIKKKREKEELSFKKEEDDFNIYKRRFHELSKIRQDKKYSIKQKYIAMLNYLVLLGRIDHKKAEKLNDKVDIQLEFADLVKNLQLFEDLEFEELEIEGEVKLEKVEKLKSELEKELSDKEKSIEDLERVSMFAPR